MQRKCAVENCLRERCPDALVCRVHLGDLWANRLDRTPSGFEPEWRKRDRLGLNAARDYTGKAAA